MQKKYLALLHKIGFTQKNFHQIFTCEKDCDFKNFYENLSFENLKKYKIQEAKIIQILEFKQKIEKEKIFEKIDKLQIKIITFFDECYPKNLKNIFNPPFLIYVRGDISGKFLAFVGSRSISSYGKKIIEKFIPDIGKYFGIISGGAAGCDAYSHQISVENNVKTVAVFGTGIDIFYPSYNEKLFNEILKKSGALVSIFPIGEPGNPYNFPVRNEIVAGWSEGVVVVEAKKKSGSLITANLSLDLGKDLFTFPGEIFRITSEGCNELIAKSEAKIVLKPEDILLEFNIKNKSEKTVKQINFSDDLEKSIYNLLIGEALNIDEISEKLNLDVSTISFKISFMELMGIIKKGDNGKFEII